MKYISLCFTRCSPDAMGCEIRPTLTDFRWSELAGKLAVDGDPRIRLEPISHFIGGNRSVLDEGMARLGLAMPGGYQRDQGKDTASGEYNPLNAGIWDYDTIEAMLKSRIGISALPKEAEAFFDSVGTLMWWGGGS